MNLVRTLLLVTGLSAGLVTGSVRAQNAPAGPVHLPAQAPASTAAASSNPAPASAPAVFNPTPAPASAVTAPTLSPTTSATTGDIRDIHGVISIPYEWLWAAYLLGAALALTLVYAAWRYFRKHAAAKAKLPFEVALERLDAARALMTTDTVREYAFTVSEIIRVYIEQRFGEKAARRTTEEFLSDLLQKSDTPLTGHRALLEDFLNHCDLIKFARWGASERELESMHESARAFIIDTHPQPAPVRTAKSVAATQPEPAQVK